jgi:hypothetical protein
MTCAGFHYARAQRLTGERGGRVRPKGQRKLFLEFRALVCGLLSLLAAVATVLGMFVKTALFGTVAVVALLGGTMLAVGSAREKSESPTAAGTPTIGTQAPRTTTSTTTQGGPGLDSEPETGGPGRTAGGQDGSPNTARSTATGGNPTQPDGGPAPANDAVRYQAVSGSPTRAQCVWS